MSSSKPQNDEIDYFQRRVPGRTYISNMFAYNRPNSKDIGFPARNINQVLIVMILIQKLMSLRWNGRVEVWIESKKANQNKCCQGSRPL